MKQVIFTAVSLAAALLAAALPKHEDFNVTLAGVAAIGMNDSPRFAKPQLPGERLIVAPGQVALFLIEYTLPPDVKSRLFLTANGRLPDGTELPFGYSASAAYSGTGRMLPVLFLPPESCEKPVLLTSVRVEGELIAEAKAPRNKPFFLCDLPVNILFSQDPSPDPATLLSLQPAPAPAIDPALGRVTIDDIPFPEL